MTTRRSTLVSSLAHVSTYNLLRPFSILNSIRSTSPIIWGTCNSYQPLLNKQLQPNTVRKYLQHISTSKSTIMSTRKLRPRVAKITDTFNQSKHNDAGLPDLTAPKIGGAREKITVRPSLSPTISPADNGGMEQPKKPSEVQVVVHKLRPTSSPVDDSTKGPSLLELSEMYGQLSSDWNPHLKKRARRVAKKGPKTTKTNSLSEEKKPQKKKEGLRYLSGVTPYPDLVHPTPEECCKVTALLTAAHGPAIRPETVPEPDNEVSGCGEVPSVLDALMRTVLSANTTNHNSSIAFKSLIERYGLVTNEPNVLGGGEAVKDEDGKQAINMAKKIGEGSVDWDNVRKTSFEDLKEAIKSGGLATTKARNLKGILDDVYKESQERIKTKLETEGIKIDEDEEIQGDVSIEYLKYVGDDEVMQKLMNFNGVGCKTAACVALFCLGRPKFPVDTHVWRISRFLSWVPDNASREETYYHLDARIPNELKYALHNLLIRHGRTCAHCKAGPERAVKNPPKVVGKSAKRPHSEDEDTHIDDSAITRERKMKTKKVWVGTGMMKEVVVEIPDDGIEGPEEKELELCVLEELVNRVRKPAKGRNNLGSAWVN